MCNLGLSEGLAKPEEGLRSGCVEGAPRGEESETPAPGQICWAPPDPESHPVMFPGLSVVLVTSASESAGLNDSVKLGCRLPGFSFCCVPLGFDHFAVSVLEGTLQGGSFQRWSW